MQEISKLESWMHDWWLGMRNINRWSLRFLVCLLGSMATGMAFHCQNENFWLKPEPLTITVSIFTFLTLFAFSILWTRTAKDRKSLREVNEKLIDASEQLADANKELADMNEELARWNVEANEVNKRLEESQRLLQEAYSQLKLRNNYDAVTGVHSRHYYDDNKSRFEPEARRHGWYFWAVSLDLNRLKNVNDTLGHAAGDNLLRFFAEKIKALVRSTDLYARVGGDEFCILGIDAANNVAENLVTRILKDMDTWFMEIMGISIKVSASVGYASAKFDENCTETADNIIELADQNMYEHKRSQGIHCDTTSKG